MRIRRATALTVLLLLCACTQRFEGTGADGGSCTYLSGRTFANLKVCYRVSGGRAIFQDDIDLGSVEEARAAKTRVETQALRRALAVANTELRWPRNTVPFVLDESLDATVGHAASVREVLSYVASVTNVHFVERTSDREEPDYVTFRAVKSAECLSQVGRRGGQQFVTLGPGCRRGQILHEVGHVLGLWHEHSRSDRDGNIVIHFENIDVWRAPIGQFDRLPGEDDIGRYDFDSVMHPGPADFALAPGLRTIEAKDGRKAFGQRERLSDGDLAALRFLYPAAEEPPVPSPTATPAPPPAAAADNAGLAYQPARLSLAAGRRTLLVATPSFSTTAGAHLTGCRSTPALPAGLLLSADCRLSADGDLAALTAQSFTVTGTTSTGQSVSAPLALEVLAAPSGLQYGEPWGYVNTFISKPPTFTGGVGKYFCARNDAATAATLPWGGVAFPLTAETLARAAAVVVNGATCDIGVRSPVPYRFPLRVTLSVGPSDGYTLAGPAPVPVSYEAGWLTVKGGLVVIRAGDGDYHYGGLPMTPLPPEAPRALPQAGYGDYLRFGIGSWNSGDGAAVLAHDFDRDGGLDWVRKATTIDGFLTRLGAFAFPRPYPHDFHLALCDMNGDGAPELVTAPVANGGSQIRVYQFSPGAPSSPALIGAFAAYDAGMRWGVLVACGDVDGDGRGDIVTLPDTGAPGHLKVYGGTNPNGESLIGNFFAFDPAATDASKPRQLAVADFNGDGLSEIVVTWHTGTAAGYHHLKQFRGGDFQHVSSQYGPNGQSALYGVDVR